MPKVFEVERNSSLSISNPIKIEIEKGHPIAKQDLVLPNKKNRLQRVASIILDFIRKIWK